MNSFVVLQRMMDNFEKPVSFTFGDEVLLLSDDAARGKSPSCECRVVNGYHIGPDMTEDELQNLVLPDPHFCFVEGVSFREIGENITAILTNVDTGTDFRAQRILLISGPHDDSPDFLSFTTSVLHEAYSLKYLISSMRQFYLFTGLSHRLEIRPSTHVTKIGELKILIIGFHSMIQLELRFDRSDDLERFIRELPAAMPKYGFDDS